MAESFFQKCYEQAFLKAFPKSFSALKMRIEKMNGADEFEVREVLKDIKKFLETEVDLEKGHINLWGRYKALDISVTPEGTGIEIFYHGASEYSGEEDGLFFNSEKIKLVLPSKTIRRSEVASELGIKAFDVVCHVHFPEMTREDYWQQQPNTKEKESMKKQKAQAQAFFEKEKAADFDLNDALDSDFSIRFPELVEYLKDCASLFYCEKKGIELSEEVIRTTGDSVEAVLNS